MIKADQIAYEYFRRDSDDNVIAITRAVDGVSFHVAPGEFVSILGHNGSGKSTLAKHINAILVPAEGTLWVDGMDTKDEELLFNIRKEAGMVFQNPDNQLIYDVVEEDVGFGPENLGVPTKKIWERVEDSLKKVGMWKYRHKSPSHLSGGQKQRVAIAGILAMHPKCIVMDESTAMLDPLGRDEVLKEVLALNKEEHITVLWITHYMDEVIPSDRVLVMNKGKVVMEGTPRDIFSRVEELKTYHLDVPQITRLAYSLRENGLPIRKGILTRQELLDELLSLQKGGFSCR